MTHGAGLDEPPALHGPSGAYFLHADRLGSVIGLSDAGGEVGRYRYDPYGATLAAPAVSNDFRYTAREYEDEDLYYYRARYYDPGMRRFIGEDPIGLAGGLNLYAYAGGDPVNYTDPLGLWRWGDPLPQNWVNFSAGMGDVILFGQGQRLRDWFGIDGGVDRCSSAYSAGEWAGLGASFLTGAAGGVRAAGTRGAGLEFSHWIPNRWGGPRSIWNGNYVPTRTHALSDPYRYRFMPRSWKAENPMPGRMAQQWVRLPNVYKGAGAGTAWGGAGKLINSDECGCP